MMSALKSYFDLRLTSRSHRSGKPLFFPHLLRVSNVFFGFQKDKRYVEEIEVYYDVSNSKTWIASQEKIIFNLLLTVFFPSARFWHSLQVIQGFKKILGKAQ